MDEVTVTLSVGTPPRTYRLMVAFSSSFYPAIGAHFVLFNSQHRMHSNSYQTIIDERLGVDTFDFSGYRWRAKVAHVNVKSSRVDGVWLISPDDHSMASGAWERFLVGRRGLRTSEDVEKMLQRNTCNIPLAPVFGQHRAVGVMNDVVLSLDDEEVPGRFRVFVVPENITTYLPTPLFQQYFRGRNIFSDDPARWPSIKLSPAGQGCGISWDGEMILPRSSLSPGGSGHSSEPVLQTIMREDIQSDSAGEMTLGHAIRGYNALKVHPQAFDNTTILLGGNVLWGAADIYVDQASGEVRLIASGPGRHITLLDALWFILLSVSYLRWKFGGSWIDTCDRNEHFMLILSRASLFASLSVFWSHLSAYIFYLPLAVPGRGPADDIVLYGGIFANVILAMVIAFQLREIFVRATRDLVRQVVRLRFRLAGKTVPVASAAPIVPERLKCHQGSWDPRQMYGRARENRDFEWLPLSVFVLYSVLLDIAFAATAWITVAPFEDRLFADIILTLSFTVASYEVAYFTLLLATAIFVYGPGFRLSQRIATFLCVAALSAGVMVFSARYVIYRIIDDYSSMYQGQVLGFVTTFYILIILFVASQLARKNIQNTLVPLSQNASERS